MKLLCSGGKNTLSLVTKIMAAATTGLKTKTDTHIIYVICMDLRGQESTTEDIPANLYRYFLVQGYVLANIFDVI